MRAFTLADERDVAEVIIVVAAIGVFLWFGRQVFSGFDVLFGISLLAMLAYSHRRAGERWREIGHRYGPDARELHDQLLPTLRLLLPVVLLGGVAIAGASIVLRELGVSAPRKAPAMIPVFVAFGIAQQYVMLGFMFRRVQRVAGVRFAPILTAVLFALLHLPNVFLTSVTFVWGMVACLVYRRSPNIWANGLVHGLMSAQLFYLLPQAVTHGLHVGMEYVHCCTVR